VSSSSCPQCSGKAESERSARRRRQVYDFVRPSEEAGSFQTRSQNERLTVRLSTGGRVGVEPTYLLRV
jgi:hypothetical protein